MNEEFLWYLWKYQLFNAPLMTTEGKPVRVVKPGIHNIDSGPDFFNGQVKIDHTLWAGNIEIHTYSSDWFRHKHPNDPAYDNIIVHIVYSDDKEVYRKNNEKIPTIELKDRFDRSILDKYRSFILSQSWIACENSIEHIDYFRKFSWLERVMVERLENKTELLHETLKHSKLDFNEIFYRRLLRNFGFKTNGPSFETLASSLSLGVLAKHSSSQFQLEALLFGQAALLHSGLKDKYPNQLREEYNFLAGKYGLEPVNKGTIKFLRMRPSNFPTLRISQFANLLFKTAGLLHKMLEAKKMSEVASLFRCQASEYWNDHYRFDKVSKKSTKLLGKSSIHLLLINTVIPFLFIYGKITNQQDLQQRAIEWLEQIPAEKNALTANFVKFGLSIDSAMHSQAVIQLKKHYCDQKRCLECGIGLEILKPSKSSV